MTDLDRLDALAGAATPGPWIRTWASFDVHAMGDDDVLRHQRDIDFAVALVNAYPALLAAVRERDELREAAEEMFRRAGVICPDCGAVDPHPPDDGTCAALPLRAALHREAGA